MRSSVLVMASVVVAIMVVTLVAVEESYDILVLFWYRNIVLL